MYIILGLRNLCPFFFLNNRFEQFVCAFFFLAHARVEELVLGGQRFKSPANSEEYKPCLYGVTKWKMTRSPLYPLFSIFFWIVAINVYKICIFKSREMEEKEKVSFIKYSIRYSFFIF